MTLCIACRIRLCDRSDRGKMLVDDPPYQSTFHWFLARVARASRLSVTADNGEEVEEVDDVKEEEVWEEDDKEVEWPGEAEYAARVATGLEAPAGLEPLVREVARLSWRRHELLGAWVEDALEKLEEVPRRAAEDDLGGGLRRSSRSGAGGAGPRSGAGRSGAARGGAGSGARAIFSRVLWSSSGF